MQKRFKFLFVLLLCSSFSVIAGIQEDTMIKHHVLDEQLDPVGAKLINEENGEELIAHCVKQGQNKDCKEAVYVLKTKDGEFLYVYTSEVKADVNLQAMDTKKELRRVRRYLRYGFNNVASPLIEGSPYLYTILVAEEGGALLWPMVPLVAAMETLLLPIYASNALRARKHVQRELKMLDDEELGREIEVSAKHFEYVMNMLFYIDLGYSD